MIIPCPHCQTKNRVPASRLHQPFHCGKCKEAMGPVDFPINVASEGDFDELVRDAQVPVLLDFWAAWCAPCRMAAPHVKTTAKDMAGRALAAKIDTVALGNLAMRFRISGIPHFMVYAGGEVVREQPGLVDSRTMKSWLEQAAG